MKKLLILTLTTIMVFTLVACGGGTAPNNGPPAKTPPATTPNNNDPAPPNNGGDNGNGGSADNGTSGDTSTPEPPPIVIGGPDSVVGGPDSGSAGKYKIPVNAPAPFESHPSDAEHFFAVSDDYVIWKHNKHDSKGVSFSIVAFTESGTQHGGFSIDGERIYSELAKVVFGNNADAQAYADGLNIWAVYVYRVDNVVYLHNYDHFNETQHGIVDVNRGNILELLSDYEIVYISKP
ncbi:MAG: hypothetical protein FWD44_06050 [Oscillospiraceae bacterium]|nr:hypothetical protein [Oscillospiraceae bacterium]